MNNENNDFKKLEELINKLGEGNDTFDNSKQIAELYNKLVNDSQDFNECVSNLNFNDSSTQESNSSAQNKI